MLAITTASFWEELSSAARQDRRGEERITRVFPIAVFALENTGRFSSECTTTRNISEFGVCFETSLQVEAGSVVAVRLLERRDEMESERTALFQIEWIRPGGAGDRVVVGASSLKMQTLWHMAFPRKD